MTIATLEKSTARVELGKFLRLADALGPGLKMFSTFIDSEWHELVSDEEKYQEFCAASETQEWVHQPNEYPIIDRIEWVPEYENRWGFLPASWFADELGVVNERAYRHYLASHEVVASWDCSPKSPSNGRL